MRPAHIAISIALALGALAGCGDDEVGSDDVSTTEDLTTEDAEAAASELSAYFAENGLSSAATTIENIDLDELADVDEYTFLAPEDDAFLALSAEDAAEVMSDDEALRSVLRNHLVEGIVDVDSLEDGSSITAISGMELAVQRSSSGTTIGGADVGTVDIETDRPIVLTVNRLFLP